MPKFKKGEGGYWLGKTFKKRKSSRHILNCIKCGNQFWRSDYAYRKGLENPKMMPKFCNRKCQLSGNKHRKDHIPANSFKVGEMAGEKHWNWQRGKTTDVITQIRKLSVYKRWREAILKRDGFMCVYCKKTGDWLEVDHHPLMFFQILEKYKIDSIAKAAQCDLLWNVGNGQTLCRICHEKKTHGDKMVFPKNVSGLIAYNAKRTRRILKCETCGKEWQVKGSHYKKRFCSQKCIVRVPYDTSNISWAASGFKGVRKKGNRYRAFSKGKHIGMFATPEEAHAAYLAYIAV